jgi:aryl carrier-like protein
MDVNDDAGFLKKHGALEFIASMLAPTVGAWAVVIALRRGLHCYPL